MRPRGTIILTILLVASFTLLTGTMVFAQEEGSSSVSCSPEDPPPTSMLTCQVEGLQADSAAQWSAAFAGGSTDGGEVTADANGAAQFQLEVPDEPGEYTVTVDGVAADGGAYSESTSGEVKAQGPEGDDDPSSDDGEGNNGEGEGNGEGNAGEGEGNGEGNADGEGNGEGEGEGQEKISLCHATASDTNPYVFITVGAPAATKGGHANHDGDIIPADGPEDCSFGEAVLSCVSTAGVGSEDANPILCRATDLDDAGTAEWEGTCPDGSSRTGVLTADGDGVARFDFTCPSGDFQVFVLGSSTEGEVVYEQSGTGVAGVFFGDEEAAPAPSPQVAEVPVGPVAAGYGGTAEPEGTSWLVVLGLLGVAALSTMRLTAVVRRASGGNGRTGRIA